jgi:DNA ligase 1
MKRFTDLYTALDETNRTTGKVAALAAYFDATPPEDAAWAVRFLSGDRPKRVLPAARLREWAREVSGVPEWLFEECYEAVGDMAETVSLLLPPGSGTEVPFHVWVEERLLSLRRLDEDAQRQAIVGWWRELDGPQQLLVFNKLLTGGFRVGVSQKLVVRGLAACGRARAVEGLDEAVLAHRLMGHWRTTAESFLALFGADTADADASRPYPFYLAYPLEVEGETPEALAVEIEERLGPAGGWQVEWKWDGIRGQAIHRAGAAYLWSRGEELVTERFPEVADAVRLLPDGTVLDGELLPVDRDGRVLPFGQLQRRIGRKTLGKKILREVPVALVAYDLLEAADDDLRSLPLEERRRRLEDLLAVVPSDRLRLSPVVGAQSWEQVAAARERARDEESEGLMIKRRASPYRVGRKRGDWWKWKVEPFRVDAVMIYAQRGHGRRASLYTDYTFGVWDGDQLVPFAKAYSGLTDAEIRKVDRFVRNNTLERFGPVRSVKAEQVFELAFEDIRRSSRHKSGIAVRFPRIHRWRKDKPPEEADTLDTIKALLPET